MSALLPERFFTHAQLALARAVADGDAARIATLAADTDLATPGAEGMTLLAFALARAAAGDGGALAAVSALVRAGADALHQQVEGVGTAVDLACAAATPDLLAALLDGGVAPGARVSGTTPILFRAAHEGSPGNVAMLVARGADVNARDVLGTPAVTYALRALQLDQVDELLAYGADPSAVNLRGESFLYVLHALMARQEPDSPAYRKMSAIAARYRWDGAPWPPDPPEVERDRLRARGITPIVPAGLPR
jgi:ankyrin repeat protein